MTTHPGDDADEETIEDLEAPAEALGDVAGGAVVCAQPTCAGSKVAVGCDEPTCRATASECVGQTAAVIVHEM
jgi:hypothetical protein